MPDWGRNNNIKRRITRKGIAFCLLCAFGSSITPSFAQEDTGLFSTSAASPFDNFFEVEEPLEITLEFDLKTLQRSRDEESYQPAMMTVYNQEGDHSYPVRIRTRGTYRKSYCNIPPVWINIRNSGIENESLQDSRKFKVVNRCMKSRAYEDYVIKEYLVYKIYQLISPYSFRVRLLNITYIDKGRSNNATKGWAFAIEPEKMLADRLDATLVENDKLAMSRMNNQIMDRLSMFYYMTGNTDFSITGMHNVKILRLNNPGPYGNIPVPYDFDFTGFVNALYATPAANTPIEEVTDRYFVGLCRSDQVYQEIIGEYLGLSDQIHDLLQSFEYMEIEDKMEMLRFIEGFFDEISKDDFIRKKISGSCK